MRRNARSATSRSIPIANSKNIKTASTPETSKVATGRGTRKFTGIRRSWTNRSGRKSRNFRGFGTGQAENRARLTSARKQVRRSRSAPLRSVAANLSGSRHDYAGDPHSSKSSSKITFSKSRCPLLLRPRSLQRVQRGQRIQSVIQSLIFFDTVAGGIEKLLRALHDRSLGLGNPPRERTLVGFKERG